MRSIWGASLILSACCEVFGQSPPTSRAFEVASIRLQPGPVGRIGISTSGPRLKAEGSSVFYLIMYAYNLKNYQVSRNPSLMQVGETMYDIAAIAGGERIQQKLSSDRCCNHFWPIDSNSEFTAR